MSLTPYASAAELARALDKREVSAAELTEAAIARIDALDGPINAVCVKTYERARASAKAADERRAKGERGALLGVPMTVKESFNLTGTPTTWGFAAAREFLPEADALAVERVERAGAVILGKTNVPPGLGDWQSYNEIYGVTNNPYDLGRSPGGSSGGSSAALAAGFGALSLGSDIGGSLRVPAHFCGVYAHKPTYDLCPTRGHTPPGLPALPGTLDLLVIGPMARSAWDLEALLDAIAGPDELDMGVGYRLALPPARADNLAGFRVLLLDKHPLVDTQDCVAEALAALGAGLERAGVRVARHSHLLPDLRDGAQLYIHLVCATSSARVPDKAYAEMVAAAERLSPDHDFLVALQLRGATTSYRDWFLANARRNRFRAQWRALFREFDAVVMPVTPTPAFPHDHEPEQFRRKLIVNGKPQEYYANVLSSGVATLPGLPATALPIGRSPAGLPIGAQIVGPWLEDRTPLKLAQLIEREFGGFVAPAV